MSKKSQKIVITGIGPVTPLGIGRNEIYKGVLSKKDGLFLRESKLTEDVWDKSYVHLVKEFDINKFDIDKNDLEYIKNWKEGEHNRDLLFMLGAVKLACDDGGVNYQEKNNNLSMIVAHENPGLEQCLMKTYKEAFSLYQKNTGLSEYKFYEKIFSSTLKSGYESQSFMTLFHIARTFNIKNYSLLLNNACASGLFAIDAASDLLKLGKAKQVIVVAGDCPDVFKTIWLKSINMYQEDGKIKPFDLAGKGFVMGEGATAFIVENYESAKERNARIYAEYLGGGFNLEGWGVTTPMIGGQFYQNVLKDAFLVSGLHSRDIGLVCAHGVGTLSSDYYEAKAITDVFGEGSVPITALKPYIGHNLGGSNLIELAILLLSLENQMIPPILNTKNPNDNLGLDLVLEQRREDVDIIMKTCCAFAGYNAASIFKIGK